MQHKKVCYFFVSIYIYIVQLLEIGIKVSGRSFVAENGNGNYLYLLTLVKLSYLIERMNVGVWKEWGIHSDDVCGAAGLIYISRHCQQYGVKLSTHGPIGPHVGY